MTDFTFNPDYQDQIELAANAVQAAERAENELVTTRFEVQQSIIEEQAAYNVTVIRAQADMEQKILSYQANLQKDLLHAQGINAIGEAEANAVMLMNEALAKSDEYVALVLAEGWNGDYPDWYWVGNENSGIILDMDAAMDSGVSTPP